MNLQNEHIAKIRLNSAFRDDSFRRLKIENGVHSIIGQLKGNSRNSALNYAFDSSIHSLASCRKWLKAKDIPFMRIESAAGLEDQRDIISNQLDEGEFQIFIRGTIGFDVSGIAVAEEIDRLNEIGAKKIIVRINSAGGDVIDGFNVVSAILRSEATIETVNEGVAASMAAVILATGDQRRAFDFSTALIHDPMMKGETLEAVEDPNQKANLRKIKNSLVKILKDATGQDESSINELMSRETVLSSAEQRKFGLVNSVIRSRVKKAPSNLSILEIMNYSEGATAREYEANHFDITKTFKMEQITNFLSLQNDASEASVLAAIQAIRNDRDELKETLEGVQNSLAESKAELETANGQLSAAKIQNAKLAVDAAIESGKFAEDQREKLTEKANADLDFFNEMVEAVPTPHSSALEVIQAAALSGEKTFKNEKGETKAKDWNWYQNNDPVGLQNLQISDPKEFDRLYSDYWGKEEPAAK